MHPGQKLKPGALVVFEGAGVRLHGEIVAMHFHGRRTIRLWSDQGVDVADAIDRVGHMPLPPYIKRADRTSERDRYQTIYARERGSIAAPTAGLHCTGDTFAALARHGVERTEVTLHVGYGTFKPIRTARIEDHTVDAEWFEVSKEAAAAVARARTSGRRVVAVGTTSARVLESLPIAADGQVQAATGQTSLFIRPGYTFRIVSALLTNFHLPQSSLLVLVAAFAGRERILDAYRAAVENRYRFYSYGDAMLIL
jgi:S-adenosylmethionine:tRNA ribosyltransferase-isomerase